MYGKVIVFVAVAVSCSSAIPFGSCGAWDTPNFGNIVGGPSNVITSGPNSVIEGPPFPTNNILTPGNIITHNVPNGLPPFPAPPVSGPTVSGQIIGGIQRFPAPITFPNIPIQGHLVHTSPIQVQNIETRVPTIQARFPTIQTRFPSLEGSLQGFPTVQGSGVFPGTNSPFPC